MKEPCENTNKTMCAYCILRQKPLTLQNGIARNGNNTSAYTASLQRQEINL